MARSRHYNSYFKMKFTLILNITLHIQWRHFMTQIIYVKLNVAIFNVKLHIYYGLSVKALASTIF